MYPNLRAFKAIQSRHKGRSTKSTAVMIAVVSDLVLWLDQPRCRRSGS
jgi:hypothetical protein